MKSPSHKLDLLLGNTFIKYQYFYFRQFKRSLGLMFVCFYKEITVRHNIEVKILNHTINQLGIYSLNYLHHIYYIFLLVYLFITFM